MEGRGLDHPPKFEVIVCIAGPHIAAGDLDVAIVGRLPPGIKQFLPWYDAYNDIKHDREKNFAQAKLIHALTSVTGCFAMLCAQYGWGFARRPDAAADAFFQLIEAPKWEPTEIYVPPLGTTYKERPYSFGP